MASRSSAVWRISLVVRRGVAYFWGSARPSWELCWQARAWGRSRQRPDAAAQSSVLRTHHAPLKVRACRRAISAKGISVGSVAALPASSAAPLARCVAQPPANAFRNAPVRASPRAAPQAVAACVTRRPRAQTRAHSRFVPSSRAQVVRNAVPVVSASSAASPAAVPNRSASRSAPRRAAPSSTRRISEAPPQTDELYFGQASVACGLRRSLG
jgi:hypothetical protein